ncbi:pilus assembly protein [Vibrio europaeus]|uniref:TadE/TadG family type IV pilus assembly protein n=1 Tax=Vibrio europaeus TaxID=300876 RepID=UPI00233E5F3B|nr:TadE family protein [Vibrio europaeus]MDC5805646.1 pilus assembly protein [Vibrio europaeus]MDC5826280.1 pilus assembly protein [Vibrio europaeus]MDC5831645.1 pilus assembly protein [Vibrio europaeus]MDC5834600.1 pilus assembly protein [Vibrio europaeus]
MKKPLKRRQKGVFAIEFALGFIVLILFTMLIFETCRLTYICSVLDYATAEAARDARVQLQKNEDEKFNEYKGKTDCAKAYEGEPDKIAECRRIKSIAENELAIWYYSFLQENSTTLLKFFTSQSDFELDVKPFLNANEYIAEQIYSGSRAWDEAKIAEYEVTYTYRPLMFHRDAFGYPITRRLLIIQDTAMFREELNGGKK